MSRPAWGAWIETHRDVEHARRCGGRAPHGARGLKPLSVLLSHALFGRAPHGARGLKQLCFLPLKKFPLSRPAWGAWIETHVLPAQASQGVAPRMGRVD